MPAPNDIVFVSESTLNTSAAFKPSEFVSAYISWTQPIRQAELSIVGGEYPADTYLSFPYVVINTTKNPSNVSLYSPGGNVNISNPPATPPIIGLSGAYQQPQVPVSTITLGLPYISGTVQSQIVNNLTLAQASTALQSVYNAVNAYYTAINS